MYGHVCAVCGGVANEVDHIEPLSSFPFEERHKANLLSNLQLLCRKHHNEKTRQEARDRHGSDGYDPLQDMHNYHKSNRSRKKARQRANNIWYK